MVKVQLVPQKTLRDLQEIRPVHQRAHRDHGRTVLLVLT